MARYVQFHKDLDTTTKQNLEELLTALKQLRTNVQEYNGYSSVHFKKINTLVRKLEDLLTEQEFVQAT